MTCKIIFHIEIQNLKKAKGEKGEELFYDRWRKHFSQEIKKNKCYKYLRKI